MGKLQNKKEMNRLVLLFTFTYMISYMTRINFSAIISAIGADTQIPRDLLSMSLTGSFITYGAGQIISGICGDRFSPKKLVAAGLGLSVLMNLIIPVCQNPYQMLAAWCVNGFAQAFMWPPMVRLMTALLTDEMYKKASVRVSWGSSFGTIAMYLISPLIISLLSWRYVFVFSALSGILMIFMWYKFSYDLTPENKTEKVKTKFNYKIIFSPLMIFVMIAIILQGMLRDGVQTWMPTYITEEYNYANVISILSGVVLPLFSIACFQIASRLYRSKFKNPLTCAGVIFAFGTISAAMLLIFQGINSVVSIALFALVTGSMHGVNLILICMIPPFFQKYGNVSSISGIINSCTYIGSAISTYGIAVISDKMGWSFTFGTWVIIACLGAVICFACSRPWKKMFS